jgi:murein DD-endopeptidase MepM/ murein hydrolase activator NlpD
MLSAATVSSRFRYAYPVAAVAVLAAILAGCASQRIDRATTGTTSGGTGQVSYDQPLPPALVGNNPISEGQANSGTTTTAGGVTTGTLPPATGTPANYTPTQPTTVAAATPTPATENTVHIVTEGETLYSLSRAYGVSVAAIAGANGLTQTSTLTIGQRLVIPAPGTTAALGNPPAPLGVMTANGTAPTTDTTPTTTAAATPTTPAPTTTAAGGTYVVQTGDTLYGIATRHGISVAALAGANNMTTSDFVRVGQQLTIPGGGTTTTAQQTPPATTSTTAPAAEPTPAPAQPAAQVAETNTTTATDAAPTQVANLPTEDNAAGAATATGTEFRWPAQGRVISDFGVKPGGERNDGINISVPLGTPVHAAEAGTVIYAGNGIAGYGNLILIQHADNWVTAYAHLSQMDVDRGATVTRGQVIAEAGNTGAVTAAQLHFELRRGTTPVNPLDYLTN